jgi:hypothetical protein
MGESYAFWDRALKDVADQGRAGAVDPVSASQVNVGLLSEDGRTIFALMEEAQKSGLPLTATLQAMRYELRAARHIGEKHAGMVRLMVLKALMNCVMALFLRFCLLRYGMDTRGAQMVVKIWGLKDAQAILLGIIWLGLGAAFWIVIVPRSWLWGRNISPLGVRWFAAHLLGAERAEDPWCEEIQRIKHHAWLQGISSLREIRQSLESWAQEKNHQTSAQLRHLEELFPLWELSVLGLSMILFLIVPMMTSFAIFGEDQAW